MITNEMEINAIRKGKLLTRHREVSRQIDEVVSALWGSIESADSKFDSLRTRLTNLVMECNQIERKRTSEFKININQLDYQKQ